MSEEKQTKLVHIKVIDGSQADIYEIAQAFKRFSKSTTDLPYKIQAIVTNDHVELQDVDSMIRELYKLKKMIDAEKRIA
jgi:hypothetical protein